MSSAQPDSWKGVELSRTTGSRAGDDATTDSLIEDEIGTKGSVVSKSQEERGGDISKMETSLPPRRRKQYAVSTRWEREQAERKRRGDNPMNCDGPPDGLNSICCCCCQRIGGMTVLWGKSDGTPIILAGPCWPFCTFVTLPLIVGLSGLVSYFIVLEPSTGLPWWLSLLYFPVLAITLLSLFFVSCRDPGLIERVTDEEAGHGGWFWNEQVGSFRPAGAMYCRECKALIQDYDHLCPWTGTGIGRGNMIAFRVFVVSVNVLCYFSIGLVSFVLLRGIGQTP